MTMPSFVSFAGTKLLTVCVAKSSCIVVLGGKMPLPGRNDVALRMLDGMARLPGPLFAREDVATIIANFNQSAI